jgi:hypothetical protein
MAFKHQGKEIGVWMHRGKELTAMVQNGREIHSSGNMVTADGYILLSADGFVLNAKDNKDGKI